MRMRLFFTVLLLAVWTAGAIYAQITANPIPAPVEKRGLMRRDQGRRAPARHARAASRRSGRDAGRLGARQLRARSSRRPPLRQRLARLPVPARSQQSAVGVRERRRRRFRSRSTTGSRAASSDSPSIRSSRGTACSTPCTASARPGNPATPNFIPPGFTLKDVTYHNVITEWHATNPAANTFEGTRRELLRVAHVVANLTHPMGAVEFNPTAKPGAPDYGLLYTSGSDLGFSNGGGPNANNPGQTQRLDSIITRDPAHRSAQPVGDGRREGPRRLHDSGGQQVRRRRRSEDARRDLRLRLPQRAPAVVGPHRRDDVRLRHRHEPHRGDQHRPQRRELRLDEARGALRERRSRGRAARSTSCIPLPADILDGRAKDGFTYPVAIYDHDEGRAVTRRVRLSRPHRRAARQVRLRRHPAGASVRGRPRGDEEGRRRHSADRGADRGNSALRARRRAATASYVSLQELVERTMGATVTRADLHISRSRDGELFITSRQDGMIRMLVP